jgi:4-hydroxy-tetrahydrodipicolinate synthase
MSEKLIHGIVPIIPTPFDQTGQVDEDDLRRLIDFAVICHADAICLPAYGSEFYKLTDEERLRLVEIAASHAQGRVPVIGQANHFSVHRAAELARRMVASGADVISVALPRLFALRESDLLRYAVTVAHEVEVPVLIQDFNPGGATVGATFCVQLHNECPNFRYIKLEEPMMGPKMQSIHEATADAVNVFEGWGGLYMMELVPVGLRGIMPGLVLCDVLSRIFSMIEHGQAVEAFALFSAITPYLNYSLQNMELFHWIEKRALIARGAMKRDYVRDATLIPDPTTQDYGEFLLERLHDSYEAWGMAFSVSTFNHG